MDFAPSRRPWAPVRALVRGFQGLLDLLLPPRCLACLEPLWSPCDTPLCLPCCSQMPTPVLRCPRCARQIGPYEGDPRGCPACVGPLAIADPLGTLALTGREPLAGVLAAHGYTGTARRLVVALKFDTRLRAVDLLAADLAEAIAERDLPGDLLVPVPLSARRRRQRGYDQAWLLAQGAARRLELPVSRRALRKRRHTPPQTSLSRAGRRRAVRGAYVASARSVGGRAVLLVDDVLTTGATARAAALALRRAGAVRVVAAVACRA